MNKKYKINNYYEFVSEIPLGQVLPDLKEGYLVAVVEDHTEPTIVGYDSVEGKLFQIKGKDKEKAEVMILLSDMLSNKPKLTFYAVEPVSPLRYLAMNHNEWCVRVTSRGKSAVSLLVRLNSHTLEVETIPEVCTVNDKSEPFPQLLMGKDVDAYPKAVDGNTKNFICQTGELLFPNNKEVEHV